MPRILSKRFAPTKIFFVIGEAVCIICSILLAMYVRTRFDFDIEMLAIDTWSKIILMAFVCQLSLYYNDLYDLKVTANCRELGLRLTQALGIASIVLAAIYYALPSAMLGRGIFLISIGFIVSLVCSWRYLYSWVLKKRMFLEQLMILGSGELGRAILAEISDRKDSGYRIAAIVDNPGAEPGPAFDGVPVLARFDRVYEEAVTRSVRQIVVALDERRGKLPLTELLRCKMAGITVADGISFYEQLTGKILVEKLRPSWLVFSEGFKKSRTTRLTKRLFGVVLSVLGLLITLPLLLLAAVSIKLDSRGPILYSQERCGRDGKPFRLYKFRSMRCDAEKDCGAIWAQQNDPRVTRVGKILRKLRIDELPQMWNVLKGDMSFVGPRPERPEFVRELSEIIPFYTERHNVKPGITGWAQICYPYGATMEDARKKLEYDLFYIKNMNLFFDLAVIFQTIKIVLLRKGSR
jgi:sugar transferase (PEP-CTERM system associated)